MMFCVLAISAPNVSPANDQSFRHDESGLSLDTRLGGLKNLKRHYYQDKRLGVSYLYRRGNHVCSLYVYNAGIKNIANGTGSLVQRQFDNARNEIRDMVRRGYYKNVVEVKNRERKVKTGNGSIQYLWSVFEFEAFGKDRESNLMMTARKRHFIKVRCTYLRSELKEGRGIFKRFVKDLSANLARQ